MPFQSTQLSFQAAQLPRQGPTPVPVGARTRQLLPRDPQAILNPGPAERPVPAEQQSVNPLIEIVNPAPDRGSRKRYGSTSEGEVKKRRTTTREERLEALTFLENSREWHKDVNGMYS